MIPPRVGLYKIVMEFNRPQYKHHTFVAFFSFKNTANGNAITFTG